MIAPKFKNSTFKNSDEINKYPNIKKHLDRFISIITSDNKPYGLHRAREEKFFKNEKIMSLRKGKEKMQGDNYQIDKIPLLNIPIIIAEKQNDIIQLFDKIKDNVDNINSLFYKICDFSEDEIKIIENHLE